MTTPRHDEPSRDADETVSLGARLSQARLEQDLSIADVSRRLKLPHGVIADLEADDHSRLGAPIFVRGHAQAYARLLGLPADTLCADIGRRAAPPPLVAMAPSTRLQRFIDQASRRAVYVVLTAVLVVPAFFIATQGPQDTSRVSLDEAPPSGGGVGTVLEPGLRVERPPLQLQPRVDAPSPVIASMTPYRSRPEPALAAAEPSAAQAGGFVLRFQGESWVEVVGHDGSRLEQALMRAGDELRYDSGQVDRVTLGNAGAVEVVSEGEARSTQPFSRANVARFTVSSDGRLAASDG